MKFNLYCLALLLFLSTLIIHAQKKQISATCRIVFQGENFRNKMYYIASNYGKYQTLLDSVIGTPEGKIVFEKDKKYVEGIYMLVTKDKKIETEFLMDENQHFTIVPNATDIQKIKIQDSPLNNDFFAFNFFFKTKSDQLKELETKFSAQKSKKDSINVLNKIKIIQGEINIYKHNYIKKNSPNTLALLLRLTQQIDNFLDKPTTEILKAKKDSIAYLKKHYFD